MDDVIIWGVGGDLYSGYIKIPNFQNCHFQYIFNDCLSGWCYYKKDLHDFFLYVSRAWPKKGVLTCGKIKITFWIQKKNNKIFINVPWCGSRVYQCWLVIHVLLTIAQSFLAPWEILADMSFSVI